MSYFSNLRSSVGINNCNAHYHLINAVVLQKTVVVHKFSSVNKWSFLLYFHIHSHILYHRYFHELYSDKSLLYLLQSCKCGSSNISHSLNFFTFKSSGLLRLPDPLFPELLEPGMCYLQWSPSLSNHKPQSLKLPMNNYFPTSQRNPCRLILQRFYYSLCLISYSLVYPYSLTVS